jgi:6-pyruvoyl-tetrahydropterin synthase
MFLTNSHDAPLAPVDGYDLIGDVHGCAVTLERLLVKLGYKKQQGVYRHNHRRAIFLGDIIDRGPHIREALLLVHNMVQNGSAHMVLGNHEFNAITYCSKVYSTTTQKAEYLRPHTPNNNRQIHETLEQFANHSHDWKGFLEWFRTLPLFMEFGDVNQWNAFRVVHACWDHKLIALHKSRFGNGHFDEQFIVESAQANSVSLRIKQRLTSGVDIPLPEGVRVVSSDGYERTNFRTKFWVKKAKTYGDLLFQPDPLPEDIAQQRISKTHRAQMVNYLPNEPPLFIGHYWLRGHPKPIARNVVCLDYSAVKFGRLVAYRMDGEQVLSRNKFVWEYVDP